MEHPLISGLEDKTPEDLQKSIGDLQQKLTFAQKTGNGHLCHQIRMVIESYQAVYRKKLADQTRKFEQEGSLNFDKIDIS